MIEYKICTKDISSIKLTTIDGFYIPVNMVYVYNTLIDIQKFKQSVEKLINYFPFLAGRIVEKTDKNNYKYYELINDNFLLLKYEKSVELFDDSIDIEKYITSVNINIINTNNPITIFHLTHFKDKCIFGISISHSIGDGFTIFHILNTLSNIYKGIEITIYDYVRQDIIEINNLDNYENYFKKNLLFDSPFEISNNKAWEMSSGYNYIKFITKCLYNMFSCKRYIILVNDQDEINKIKKYVDCDNFYTSISILLYSIACEVEDYKTNYAPSSIITTMNFRSTIKKCLLGNYIINIDTDLSFITDMDKSVKINSKKLYDNIKNYNVNDLLTRYLIDYERLRRYGYLGKLIPNIDRKYMWIDSWRSFNIYDVCFDSTIFMFSIPMAPIPYFTYLLPVNNSSKGCEIHITIPKSQYNNFKIKMEKKLADILK